MSDLPELHEAATPAPWRDVLVPTSMGRCHKILDPMHADEADHGYVACIYDDDTSLNDTPSAQHTADAALIVALRNAYANGDLITRSIANGWVLEAIANRDAEWNAYHEKVDALVRIAQLLLHIEGLPSEDCGGDCQGCEHPERCAAMKSLSNALKEVL